MQAKFWNCFAAMTLVGVMAIAVPLAAQKNNNHQHHHYQFIDLGTFGGPTSIDDSGTYPALNNRGTVIGMADTAAPDPFYPNDPLLLGFSDPYIFKAFQSQGGELIPLESLPGGYSTYPQGISQNGVIAGDAINGAIDPIGGWPEANAVVWRNGRVTNLGTLGGYESFGGQVNSRGQVTGIAQNSVPDPYSIFYSLFNGLGNGTQTRAFLWDEMRGMRDLGTLGGPDALSQFVNEAGEAAGFSYTSYNPNPSGFPTVDPFLWEPPSRRHPSGEMIDLGTLGGTFGGGGDGVALNNHGQHVGASNLAGDVYFHPFLWSKPGPMQDLGTFGGHFGTANAINDAGDVVGWATNTDDQALLAFFWKDGVMKNLGVLPSKLCSYAHQINSQDQVTGSSDDDCNDGNSHAFLWENGGPMVDLNDLVSGADMTLAGTQSINDRGEITGVGVLANGDLHVFLLIPCDESHPGIEGCDYSMVDAPQASSALASPRPSVSLSPVIKATMLRRSGRWYGFGRHARGVGVSPQVQVTERSNRPAFDLLGEGLLPREEQTTNFAVYRCQISAQGLTTGWCLETSGQCQKHYAGYGCPGGERARTPQKSSCGLYDAGRGC